MITYIDCGSGVAGDMLLGALVGLGLSPKELERMLKAALREPRWNLKIKETERQQWPAWSVTVEGDRPYGSIHKMRACIRQASVPPQVKKNALAILDRLQEAEVQVHGHAHASFDPKGLNLMDTVVDVLGTSWGFWKLGIQETFASSINSGRIAPATAAMLQKAKVPVFTTQSSLELATPTGVAVLLQFVKEFKPLPQIQLQKAGYGAGAQDPKGRPNVVTIYQGTPAAASKDLETVIALETVIDDMDPRLYPHVMDLLLKQGALDVWWTPIGMKKGRPGIAFTVLCRPTDEKKMLSILFNETTTLGVRRLPVDRWVLPRKAQGLRKVALLPGGRTKARTEYEVAKKISSERAVPLLKLLK